MDAFHGKEQTMLNYYFSENGSVTELNSPTPGCWVDLTSPSPEELQETAEHFELDIDTLKAALDPDERSRIENDDSYTMVLINIPTVVDDNKQELYSTIPLSMIVTKDAIITVCSEDSPLFIPFKLGKVKDFYTHMKSRFVLQILYRTARLFLEYLRIIDRKSEAVEDKLHKATKNHELIELLKLEKSLVYFSTALRSNESVTNKLFRSELIKKYPEDEEILEDVTVENRQAIEMANIYSGILSGTMGAYSSVISNNLNIAMKVLAIITVVLSVPTMIFSAYGMNVSASSMPLAENPYAFAIIIAMSLGVSLMLIFIFLKIKMFK